MQLSLELAVDAGRSGARRAADHADRTKDDWMKKACAAMLREVQKHTHQDKFTVEQLRSGMGDVESPPDLRVWGAVTVKAIAERHIVKTGEYAPAVSSNGSPKPLYRRGGGV